MTVNFLHQFFITVPHISAGIVLHSLPHFPLPSISLNIATFFIQSEICIVCPKYFNLLIAAKLSIEYLDIICLVAYAFVLLTLHGIIILSLIYFPLHPYSTAGKTVVCSSLTFALLKVPSFYGFFFKFPIAVLLKLFFSWSLHWCSCHL